MAEPEQELEPQRGASDVHQSAAAASGSHRHDVPVRTVTEDKIPYSVLKYIPEESAEYYQLIPLAVSDGVLEVGMVDPDNISGVDALNFIARRTGMPFKIFRVSEADFKKVLDMYRGLGGEVDRALTDLQTEGEEGEQKTGESDEFNATLDLDDPEIARGGDESDIGKGIQEDAPAIKLVSTILRYAIDGKASDVHIEPSDAGVRVRYRVDGTLHTSVVLPKNTHRAIVARVKVLAAIRLDERRKPQDGRFSASIEGRKVDFRVSTFPAYNGEKIVIRILDREQGFISLHELGLPAHEEEVLREAIKRPHGLILISGPTGSGKSTTLYSLLSELDREKKNVLSLEDPVEYYIDGMSQSQVRPEIGYTFANGLRTTLRQDPDVIMVGEIRDAETAKLAVQAALTGHLVLSTIHTNSAVGTIPRLIDMGVAPYLIPPVLIASMAQRLVRKLCDDAGKEVPVTESMHNMMTQQFSTLPPEYHPQIPDVVYEAQRTASCPNGTRGRLAVFEVLEMTSAIEQVILTSPVESKIWATARKQGMLTMKEDAMLKAFDGKIPFTEVNALSSLLLQEAPPSSKEIVQAPDAAASQQAAEESTDDGAQQTTQTETPPNI